MYLQKLYDKGQVESRMNVGWIQKLTVCGYWKNSTIHTHACTYKSFIWKPRLKVRWTSAGYEINSVWLLIELGRAGGISCEIVQTLCDACFYCHMVSVKLLYKWSIGIWVHFLRDTVEWYCKFCLTINLKCEVNTYTACS